MRAPGSRGGEDETSRWRRWMPSTRRKHLPASLPPQALRPNRRMGTGVPQSVIRGRPESKGIVFSFCKVSVSTAPSNVAQQTLLAGGFAG